MDDVAIIGVGLHPFGRFGDKPAIDMGAEADPRRPRRRRRRRGTTSSSRSAGAWRSMNPDAGHRAARAHRHPVHRRVQRLRHRGERVIQLTADAIRLGKCDIGVAVGMDKHPRGAFTATPSMLGRARLVRRERPVPDHQVLRHEDQPVHARPRHLARDAGQGGGEELPQRRRSTRTRSGASPSPRRRSWRRRC